MKAIVHIGTPKTGTTAIQEWLVENAKDLRAQGIGYDRISATLRPLRPAHAELSFCAVERNDTLMVNKALRRSYKIQTRNEQAAFVAKYEAQFAKKVASLETDTMVLSSEFLGADFHTQGDLTHLDAFLTSVFDEVRYVVYFRRQEDLVLSSYSQRLKEGATYKFDHFLKKRSRRDYAAKVRMWHDIVGPDRFDVRLMERDWLKDGDLIADFAHVIGADLTKTTQRKTANESLDLAQQYIIRAFNEAVPNTVNDGKMLNPLNRRLRHILIKHKGTSPRRTLNTAQIKRVRRQNSETNEDLRQLCFPDRAELFPAKPDVENAKFDRAAVVADMAVQLLARLDTEQTDAETESKPRTILPWPFSNKAGAK